MMTNLSLVHSAFYNLITEYNLKIIPKWKSEQLPFGWTAQRDIPIAYRTMPDLFADYGKKKKIYYPTDFMKEVCNEQFCEFYLGYDTISLVMVVGSSFHCLDLKATIEENFDDAEYWIENQIIDNYNPNNILNSKFAPKHLVWKTYDGGFYRLMAKFTKSQLSFEESLESNYQLYIIKDSIEENIKTYRNAKKLIKKIKIEKICKEDL